MSNNSYQASWKELPVTYLNAYWWGKRDNSMGFIIAPDIFRYIHLIRNSDIVHIHGYRHFLFVLVSWIAKYYGVPYIVQARGALTKEFGRVRLKKGFDQLIGRFILRNAAYVVSLSDEETGIYISNGVSPSKVEKILNPIDPQIFPVQPDGQAFRERYRIRRDEKILLFLARLHEKKGIDILIDAISYLKRDDFRLCIVGPDGGYQSTAESMVAERGLKRKVIFTGPLFDEQKFDAYRAAYVYILPTRGGEGLPTTVIEACFAGVPIIVTNTTEVAQIVKDRIGLVVESNSYDLRIAINTILDQPTLRSYFSQQTRSVLNEYFSLDNAISKFELIYNHCTSSE